MDIKKGGVPSLVEGALFAAIAAIFGIIGIYIPPLSIIANILWILPIIIVCLRSNIKMGIMSIIVSFILMSLFSYPISALYIIIQFGAMAIVYGIAFKKRYPVGKTILYGSCAATLGTGAIIGLSILFMGLNLDQLYNEVKLIADHLFIAYKQNGLLDRLIQKGMTEEQIKQMFNTITNLTISIYPALNMIASLFTAVLSYLVSRIIFKKMQFDGIPEMPSFTTWKLPWNAIWGINIALICFLAGDYWNIKIVRLIGINIIAIYIPIFFLIGLAIFKFYFQKTKSSVFVKILFIGIFIFNFPIVLMFLSFLGLFDTVFDYRKLIIKKDKEK